MILRTKTSVNFILLVAITLIYGLLFIVPYSFVFYIDNGKGTRGAWQSMYIINDFILIIIYAPFAIFWILFLIVKRNVVELVFKIILTALSFVYFLIAILQTSTFSPDVLPAIGSYLPVLLFPLWMTYIISTRKYLDRKEAAANRGICKTVA